MTTPARTSGYGVISISREGGVCLATSLTFFHSLSMSRHHDSPLDAQETRWRATMPCYLLARAFPKFEMRSDATTCIAVPPNLENPGAKASHKSVGGGGKSSRPIDPQRPHQTVPLRLYSCRVLSAPRALFSKNTSSWRTRAHLQTQISPAQATRGHGHGAAAGNCEDLDGPH